MTRGQLRTLLQRQLQEPAGGDQWTPAELDEAINFGLAMIEKEVLKVLPQAFCQWDLIDLESGKNEYALPTNFINVHQVKFLTSAGTYVRAPGYQYAEIDSDDPPSGNCWAIQGRYLCIRPTPTADLVNGLRLIFIPQLTLAEDTDVPPVPFVLHPGIALYAKAMLTEETGEPSDTARQAIVNMCADLPMWWRPPILEHFTIEGL